MNVFTVDILTPNKIVAKDLPAESIFVPTSRGLINILKNHTHIMTKLSVGQVSVMGSAADCDRFFSVTNGICKVLGNKITILSEISEEAAEIDKSRAQSSLDNAKKAFAGEESIDDVLFDQYMQKIELSKLRIQLAEYQEDNMTNSK